MALEIMLVVDYRKRAYDNETVFRNVLRYMRDNRSKLPMGEIIPPDLIAEATIAAIFRTYSARYIDGKFTICDFTRPVPDLARIKFQKVGVLQGSNPKKQSSLVGSGAELEYLIRPTDSVQYKLTRMTFKG